jgi:hypothetical protein
LDWREPNATFAAMEENRFLSAIPP